MKVPGVWRDWGLEWLGSFGTAVEQAPTRRRPRARPLSGKCARVATGPSSCARQASGLAAGALGAFRSGVRGGNAACANDNADGAVVTCRSRLGGLLNFYRREAA